MNQDRLAQASVVALGGAVVYFMFFRKKKKIFKQKTRSSPITAAFKYA